MTASTSIRPTRAVAGNWQGVAVLLPCRDEAQTVAGVVDAFSTTLPGATVYVYDNGSTDRTAELAAAAGAVVRRESWPGKGNGAQDVRRHRCRRVPAGRR